MIGPAYYLNFRQYQYKLSERMKMKILEGLADSLDLHVREQLQYLLH